MRSFLIATVLAIGASRPVWAHAASLLAIAVAEQQFDNAFLVPSVVPTFNPTGLMNFNFSANNLKTQIGDALAENITSSAPQNTYIHGTAAAEVTTGGPYNVTTDKYTVVLFDAGVPGSESTTGYQLHWLANDWTYGQNVDHVVTLNPPNDSSSVVFAYAGPAPPAGSGPHRYVGLTYVQPDSFTSPTIASTSAFNLTEYVSAANLGDPIAGTYFTVQNGDTASSVSVAQTSSVDSTTLPQFIPTSSASGSGSGSATSSGSSPSGSGTSGALSFKAKAQGGVVGAVVIGAVGVLMVGL